MGNFGGHALPGSFFILFSLWHLVQTIVHYFRSKRRIGPAFQCRTYYNVPCSKLPLEPILRVFLITVAIILELYTAMRHGNGRFLHIGNGQHVCMYTFFGFAGILEILTHYKFYLPNGVIYISYILAFLIEALLFYWHLHVQEPMEVQVHTLLIYIALATACVLCVEMNYKNRLLPTICRNYLVILHGIWFWLAAFILFPPSGWEAWDWRNHDQMMLVTIIFCANIAAVFVVVLVVWFVVACHFGLVRRASVVDHKNGYKLANGSNSNFMHELKLDSNDDFEAHNEEDVLISE